MLRNKKAQLGELISDLPAIFIVVLMIVVFFVIALLLFGFPNNQVEEIGKSQANRIQGHESFTAFLDREAEIEIEGQKQNVTMSDLVRLAKHDARYKALLEKEIDKIFGVYGYYIVQFDRFDNIGTEIPSFNEQDPRINLWIPTAEERLMIEPLPVVSP